MVSVNDKMHFTSEDYDEISKRMANAHFVHLFRESMKKSLREEFSRELAIEMEEHKRSIDRRIQELVDEHVPILVKEMLTYELIVEAVGRHLDRWQIRAVVDLHKELKRQSKSKL